MPSIIDVAASVVQQSDETLSAMKLQKLCYYVQAWHLANTDEPLFEEDFQAWSYGPVAPVLYEAHRGTYTIREWTAGDPSTLTVSEQALVHLVVEEFAGWSGEDLSNLTHREDPWIHARGGIDLGAPCEETITKESMRDFYAAKIGR